MQPVRFIMVGGFLGAGKTTTIARLARLYQSRGQSVAIITNDQASELVDTLSLRSQGFNVGELPGACFCGNLADLTSAVERLGDVLRPDVVLVEPVGSCTDMVASVIRPLQRMHAGEYDVAPFGVLLKASHGAKILRAERRVGVSPQAEYLFRKQLEEADFVVLNRVDELLSELVAELTVLLREQYPDTPVLAASAKTGAGFDLLLKFLDQRGSFGQRVLELDYERYAAAEAELGWLNGSFLLNGAEPFDIDELLLALIDKLRDSLGRLGVETAHLKAIGLWEGAFGVANLILAESSVELSIPSGCSVRQLHLIVNARVVAPPELLEAHVTRAMESVCQSLGLTIGDRQIQSFSPGQGTLVSRSYSTPAGSSQSPTGSTSSRG